MPFTVDEETRIPAGAGEAPIVRSGRRVPASPWVRAGIALGLSSGVVIALYWTTAVAVAESWSKDPLGHGYIVIPALAYLVWHNRRALAAVVPRPSLWALPVLGVCAVTWFAGTVLGMGLVEQAGLIALAVALTWVTLGTEAMRVLAFPLAGLVLVLPIGDRLVPVLQQITASSAARLLNLSHVPALVEANIISIPGAAWKVADACSGINYFLSSLVLAYAYAGLSFRSWTKRISLLVAAAAIAIVGNVLRVYGTILIAYLGGIDMVAPTRHFLFGWVVFASMMAVLYFVCGRWSEDTPDTGVSQRAGTSSIEHPIVRQILFCCLALLLVAAAPLAAERYEHGRTGAPDPSGAPVVIATTSRAQPLTMAPLPWRPQFVSPTSEVSGVYERNGRTFQVHVANYPNNRDGLNLATAVSAIVTDPWLVIHEDTIAAVIAGGNVRVHETVLRARRRTLRVWNWYRAGEQLTGNRLFAKLLMGKAELTGGRQGATAVVVATEDGPQASSELRDFVSTLEFTSR